MESQLKQRLVGIAVIVSLAVIFLPMLLDGAGMMEKPQYNQEVFAVPPAPKVDRRIVDLEEKEKQLDTRLNNIPKLVHNIVDDANKKQDKAAKVKKVTVKPKVTKPIAKVGGDSWIVQLGSFKDQEKAFILQKKLRSYKIAAVFIQKLMINNSKSYRVRMGPFLYQKQARAAKVKLTKKLKIQAVVMKHEQ